jgi:hypothetical protein
MRAYRSRGNITRSLTTAVLLFSPSMLIHADVSDQTFVIHGIPKSCSAITQLDSALAENSQQFFGGWTEKDYADAAAWSQACAEYGWHVPGHPRIPLLQAQHDRALGSQQTSSSGTAAAAAPAGAPTAGAGTALPVAMVQPTIAAQVPITASAAPTSAAGSAPAQVTIAAQVPITASAAPASAAGSAPAQAGIVAQTPIGASAAVGGAPAGNAAPSAALQPAIAAQVPIAGSGAPAGAAASAPAQASIAAQAPIAADGAAGGAAAAATMAGGAASGGTPTFGATAPPSATAVQASIAADAAQGSAAPSAAIRTAVATQPSVLASASPGIPLPSGATAADVVTPATSSSLAIAVPISSTGNHSASDTEGDSLVTDAYIKQHFHQEALWVASKANLEIGDDRAASSWLDAGTPAQMKNRITADKIVFYCARKTVAGESDRRSLLWDWRWCESEEAAAYNRLVSGNEFPAAGRGAVLGCAAADSYVHVERCVQTLAEPAKH